MNAAIFVIVTMCIITFFSFGYISVTGKDFKGTSVQKGQRYIFTCATGTSLIVLIAVFVLGSATVVEYLNQWLVAWLDMTHT
ncbi:MAG: hypothetical protein CFH43_01119 [Proteobacteria bacterium]|nr:MAG: hypothetical protein CFH43_01119 [Pseudomonadota bacterium]